jgi:hypothetical protein
VIRLRGVVDSRCTLKRESDKSKLRELRAELDRTEPAMKGKTLAERRTVQSSRFTAPTVVGIPVPKISNVPLDAARPHDDAEKSL